MAVVVAICLYLPQLVRLFRFPEVAGVSLASCAIALLGTISWTAYDVVVHKLPVISVIPKFVEAVRREIASSAVTPVNYDLQAA